MNESWDKARLEIINELKDYFQLYLFKGIGFPENGINKLFNLKENELNTLKSVHFFLSSQLNDFIEILPQLMRNLSHSTSKEKIISKGIIKGKIDWNKTFKIRYSQGYNDLSLFACTLPSKSYDLCENQLLKFLLKKIVYLFENTLNFIPKKNIEINESDINDIEINKSDNWQEEVGLKYSMVKKTLKNVYFNEITDVNLIKLKTLRKAFIHRNHFYKKLVNLYKLYEDLFISNDLGVLKSIVETQLLKPADDDRLYELYIFFNLVDSLKVKKLGLLMPNNDYAVLGYYDNCEVKIYYQEVPKGDFSYSKYKEIFKNYDINVSLRRPDILIDFNGSYRIVEVKKTSDQNYIRDSVYKVLGYLNDFKQVEFSKNIPGVIVVWDGINIKSKNAFNNEILILNKNEFISNLDMILKDKIII